MLAETKLRSVLRTQASLQTLKISGINTPEILFERSEFGPVKQDNVAALLTMLQRLKPQYQIVLPWAGVVMSKEDALKELDDYDGGPMLIFLAPRTAHMISGQCRPAHFWNKIKFGEAPEVSVCWGVPMKGIFPAGLVKCATELNDNLVRARMQLDGMTLRFTYHVKGEGTNGDQLVIWGQT